MRTTVHGINCIGVCLLLVLSACSPSLYHDRPESITSMEMQAQAVPIKIIAFNDFHGNLEPPGRAITVETPGGTVSVPAGGVAYLASAIAMLKAKNPLNIVVSAGDLTGASPLVSSLFLDEPTIHAMNLIGLDFNAVGNHEFDRGQDELIRLQNGGCQKYTVREPCQIDRNFPGASFRYLAANTIRQHGSTFFPSHAIRTFKHVNGTVSVGFIGLTLTGTVEIVSAAGIAGIHFEDEARSANALIPRLRAEGADIIVLLIHQGGTVTAPHGDQSCAGLAGDIVPILNALDTGIEIVISGHTHRDYICDYGSVNPSRPILLTSGGQYGTLLTDIDIMVNPTTGRIISRQAKNHIVQGEGFTGQAGPVAVNPTFPVYTAEVRMQAIVDRYRTASARSAGRVIGKFVAPLVRTVNVAGEQPLGDFIADAQLAALREGGGAQLAFMNQGGVRADLIPGPDGAVTFGAIYAVQPFSNVLTVKTFTGRQIVELLEQQFRVEGSTRHILLPSANVSYSYSWSRPAGSRVSDLMLDGRPIDPEARYRVGTSAFLGDGGDGFTVLRQGTDAFVGPLDIEALEAYFAASNGKLTVPKASRITRLDSPQP